MKEYTPEFDQMLFYLPLSGSTFKKVYYDEFLERAVSKFVPAEQLIVPYTATDLETSENVTHVIQISENELRKKQVAGFYRDIEVCVPVGSVRCPRRDGRYIRHYTQSPGPRSHASGMPR